MKARNKAGRLSEDLKDFETSLPVVNEAEDEPPREDAAPPTVAPTLPPTVQEDFGAIYEQDQVQYSPVGTPVASGHVHAPRDRTSVYRDPRGSGEQSGRTLCRRPQGIVRGQSSRAVCRDREGIGHG